MSALIAGDVGNVNTKLRKHGGSWSVEASLVRTPGTGGYSLTEEAGPRPILYLEGPAQLPATPFLVGADAQRYGATDLAIVGSAEARVRSDAYLVLHLYLIVASRRPGRPRPSSTSPAACPPSTRATAASPRRCAAA